LAFDLDFSRRQDGSTDFMDQTERRAVEWDEWVTLPIRPFDEVIETSRGWLRAPTVIMAPNFSEMPEARPRLSPRAIYERDGWICQYSGRKLHPSEANIDHVIPLRRGGRSIWTNLVCCDKAINSMKGDRLNSECGLRLIRRPRAPQGVPKCVLIRKAKHPTWQAFLTVSLAELEAVA
jgi:5-methylcytosine-specific restriction endonuclease McrA